MMDERQRIEQAIAAQESLRATVGDEVVDETIAMLRRELAHLETPEQQRKLVTILYADIVGSTDIVKHLDPEDALEIMDGSLKRLAVPVEKNGGHVARFMGDGFKAVFGITKAHENDPEMAIRAGLGILEIAQELSGELKSQWGVQDFQVRLGINTGLAALGGMTEAEDTVMGSTINLAKRVESAAPPGGLLITHNTYRHVRGVFNVQMHEPIEAKGFDEPVQVYLVEDVKPRAFRIQTRGVEGVETRMVGRKAELIALQEAYRNAIEGEQTQVISIVGEAGVGKSRLFYEFDNWIELLPPPLVLFFQGRSRQEAQYLPYALLKDVFTFRFQIQESDSAREVWKKLEGGFGEIFGIGDESQMRTHITGQLLGFDFSASQHVKGILDDPQQIRDRALMYMAEYFQGMSEQSPVVIFLEDIHWADDSSLAMVNRLVRRLKNQRLLFVCVARYRLFDRYPNWGEELPQHTQIELIPLSQEDSHELVLEILKLAEQVPVALRELIVSNAEGNPFYVEELIKMLIEDDIITTGKESWGFKTDNLDEIIVPATLTSVLQARLDSLPSTERKILQQASVVGRTFWDSIVECIHASDSEEVDYEGVSNALSALLNREMIYKQMASVFDEAKEYLFKHAILREVTYESVLLRLRRVYHQLVAQWLIEHSGERTSEYSGLIADHLELGGDMEQAAIYLFQSGEGAAKRYANSEAVEYFTRALALTPQEDLSKRYELLTAREKVLDIQGDRESQSQDLAALNDLAIALDSLERQAEVALRLANHLLGISNYQAAVEAAREAIDLAKDVDNREIECIGNKHLGLAFKKLDDYDVSRDCLEESLGLAKEVGRTDLVAEILSVLGGVDFLKGDYTEARSNYDQSLVIDHELGNLTSECNTINSLGNLEFSQGNYSGAKVFYEEALHIAREIGDRFIESAGHANLGNIDLVQGDFSISKKHYEQALSIAREIGNREFEASLIINLGYMANQLGMYPLANNYLDQGLKIFREIDSQSGECWTLMTLGEVALSQENYLSAQDYYKNANEIAREIGYTDQEGYTLSGIGDALIGMEQLDGAKSAHQKSLLLRQELDQQHLVVESIASLARVAFKRGDISGAYTKINSVLSYLDEGNALDNTEKPFRIYLTCYEVMKVNNDPRANMVLECAYKLLQERAAKISDERLRDCFLNNVAVNREIVGAYEALGLVEDALEESR